MKHLTVSITIGTIIAIGIISNVSLATGSVKHDWTQGGLEVKPYNQQWIDITEPNDLQPALGYKVLQNTVNPENITTTKLEMR